MAVDWGQITEDLRQKYVNTFVHATVDSVKTLFQVKGVNPSLDGPPEITLYNPDMGNIMLRYDGSCEIFFDYPELGYFYHGNQALLLFKKFDRQYVRGFGPNTCQIINPYARWTFKAAGIDFAVAAKAFAAMSSPSVARVVGALQKEEIISIPLSKELAMGQDVRNTNGTFLVWYYDNPIGSFHDGAFHIPTNHFKQEVKDYLSHTGQHYAVN